MTKLENIASFLTKLIGARAINFKDGKLRIMDVEGVIFPTPIFSLQQYLLMKDVGREKCLSIFYTLGELQAYMGSSQMIKRFGIKPTIKNYESSLIHQSEMIGTGKVELIKADVSNQEYSFKVYRCCWAEEYIKLFGKQKECTCFFMSGLLAGGLEGTFNEKVIAVEKSCIAKGDKECFFEVRKKFPKEEKDVPKINYNDSHFKELKELTSFLKLR